MSLTPDKSSTGMEPGVAAGVACLHWIAGLIFFLIEKDSRFVRFYAFQSMILGLSMILCAIPVLGWIYGVFVIVMWVMMLINAFGGKVFKVPVIGDIAMNQAMSLGAGGSVAASSSSPSQSAASPAADDEFGDDD